MNWEKMHLQIRNQNWIILSALGCASFLLMDSQFTLGVLLGGLIIIANFNLLQNSIRGLFSGRGAMKSRKISVVAKYYLRLFILGIIIFILVSREWVNAIGFTIGISVVVISIFCIGIRAAWKSSSGEAL